MIYAVSDIHGNFDKYTKMLEKINFSPNDTLYILGDVIDRGNDGFKILLDAAKRSNVTMLMGNHEAMALDALPSIINCIRKGKKVKITVKNADAIDLWFYNGGKSSLIDFLSLNADDRRFAWNCMNSMPLYKEVEVGGQKFLLLHGGLKHFSPSRPIEEYKRDEIVWCRPQPDTTYYSDKYVVVGHTPTIFLYDEAGINTDEARFFKTDSFIDIDCGCGHNGRLGCLCLDTMEEIYV